MAARKKPVATAAAPAPAANQEGFYAPDATPPAPDTAEQPAASPLAQHAAIALEPTKPNLTADAALLPADEHTTLAADIARVRAKRKPFGAFTQKLAYPPRQGYHRHWFNDEPGRIDEAVSNGWAHVKDKEDKPVKRVVGRGRDSGALNGFLMELPKVFWDEDMAAKHDAAQARIDEIKKNPFRAKPGQATRSDEGKFYSAKDEPVTLSQSAVRSSPRT